MGVLTDSFTKTAIICPEFFKIFIIKGFLTYTDISKHHVLSFPDSIPSNSILLVTHFFKGKQYFYVKIYFLFIFSLTDEIIYVKGWI